MDGVSVASLTLMDENVLVRGAAAEERRRSGLIVPNSAREAFGRGSEFYGVIVALGPGRLVERGPDAETVANIAQAAVVVHEKHETKVKLSELVADAVRAFVVRHTKHERVPMPWSVGSHVMCRQGFGPEVNLREGRHHLVGRGNAEHGHGIIAAWDPAHVHCWHHARGDADFARCSCGASTVRLATRLPACSGCPDGERLAEASLAAKTYDYKVGRDAPTGHFEERPVDDGTHSV